MRHYVILFIFYVPIPKKIEIFFILLFIFITFLLLFLFLEKNKYKWSLISRFHSFQEIENFILSDQYINSFIAIKSYKKIKLYDELLKIIDSNSIQDRIQKTFICDELHDIDLWEPKKYSTHDILLMSSINPFQLIKNNIYLYILPIV